ncbi:MAG: formate acetyltransferase [Anaerolineae bacterium]|nr:formate acetyltransferase [Anaerolineae bacterium]
MATRVTFKEITYDQRIEALREAKLKANLEKQGMTGSLNSDDLAFILPPEDRREVVHAISGSGVPITDVIMTGVEIKSNHPSGAFYGPKISGENYGALLRAHPPYIDPMSSLAGAYMTNFGSFRKGGWKPELDFSHLHAHQEKYQLISGIGAPQHFCQDLTLGLKLGWGGILDKIKQYRTVNTSQEAQDFYDGLEAIATGIQDWIARNAAKAREMVETEPHPQLQRNLLEMAMINEKLVTEPPDTFREACQWIVWYQMAARMYNGSGSLGKLDLVLQPYYERDKAAGLLTDEEATFHLACLLLRDTAYIQLGGPDGDRLDITNAVSFLTLEAAHWIGIPSNVAVSVGKNVNRDLLRRGVEIMFDDKKGVPKFLGIDNFAAGFARNGYPMELATQRAYSGCHWCALPGREYTLNDCVKINFGAVFQAAFEDLYAVGEPSVARLWELFTHHLQRAVETIAQGLDFQVEHMHEVFPELVLDLLSYGPIEKGIDASHGGVEHMNLCVDGAALATVADSFAALEQRVEQEERLTWSELHDILESDWAGPQGERTRLMMKSIDRFGSGGSRADFWARRVEDTFTELVKAKPTPNGHNMIPGLFSWANTIGLGRNLKATPNGRHAGDPISHGANPDPGFRKDGAPSAMAIAIADVNPGWGNSAPMQIDLDPGLVKDEDGVDHVMNLITTHFDLGGTQINMNILDKEQVLAAHKDPSLYPDLIVRVTGFSAYFNRLSPEFRQLVVDRIIAEG